ncbi:MAG: protein kinase [Deltaproteobacteria bacterium]|nr:protein kinase [Deltaproteobacteria bacterium]
MAIACSACSYENADHARFCASCGARLGQAGAERDLLFGQVIAERYRIQRVLGEGGMGRVYFAEQQMGAARRPVAIKVLRGGAHDATAVQRFNRECELVVQLTHPSTIRFYDFGKLADGRLYIAMEYVEGRSLATAIEEGPMPLASVERLVGQIGGALIEAHRRGIIHRDLKPDNILLAHNPDEGEFAKVLDFGIAKKDEAGTGSEITSEGLIVGTPAYMSPEQLAAKPLDERSDVYALALIVFEMLTGRRPFQAKTPLEWATAHMTADVPSFDEFPATRELPANKRAAILHGLQKEPTTRTRSVRAFLEEFLGNERMSILSIAPSSDRERRPSGDAPTLAATPSARSGPRGAGESVPSLPTRRTPFVILGALVMIALGAGLAFLFRDRLLAATGTVEVSDAGPPPSDAGTDAPTRTRSWLRAMTGSDRTTDVANALGPPDGQCARIAAGGKVLLELDAGTRIETDDSPSPDLEVVVGERSAAYRVDVLEQRHQTSTQVGADVFGSSSLDVDQFDDGAFRYIRVKNTNRTGEVCLDAVAVMIAAS